LQRGAEYELMLVCNRHGVHEPSVLQNIVSFNRVPFVVSYGGMHHCELCDEAFSEVPTLHRVRMVERPRLTDWAGCPGDPLAVQPCFTFAVSEVRRSGNGNWFFRTLARQPEKKTQESSSKAFPCFKSYWAPLSQTFEGQEPSTLSKHLASESHMRFETKLAESSSALVSHAALTVSKKLHELPSTSLSRFRDGLGLSERFCTATEMQLALQLIRVRDLNVSTKLLREMLPEKKQFSWLTLEEMEHLECQQQRGKKGGHKKR